MIAKYDDRISVIIPVYNVAAYLGRCLDSILQSTYKNLEVICVNDGSLDESLQILEEYRARDSRVNIINQENSGLSAARNSGMAVATGEFLSFVDSDDWVHPQMFEILRAAMADDVCMAACDNKQVYCYEESSQRYDNMPEVSDMTQNMGMKQTIKDCVWAHLYRSAFLKDVRFEEKIRYSEDRFFKALLAARKGKRVYVDAVLYYYYQRADSALHTVTWEKHFESVDAFMRLSKDKHVSERAALHGITIKAALSYRYKHLFCSESKEAAKKIKKQARQTLREMWRDGQIPKIKIIAYSAMNECLLIYRVLRIIQDPTMLKWEKAQKRKWQASDVQ